MKNDMGKSRVAVRGGRLEAKRDSSRRQKNNNMAAAVKRTDHRPALRSNAAREEPASVNEPGKRQMSSPMLKVPVRSKEAGGAIEVSERHLAESAPARMRPHEVIVQRDTTSDNVAAARDVSGREGTGGRFVKPLRSLAPHVRRVLYKPAAGSPLVAGTTVPEANVAELVRGLRERTAEFGGRGERLAAGLLRQLMLERETGPVTVEGVKIAQLKRLVDLLGQIEVPETGGRARKGTEDQE